MNEAKETNKVLKQALYLFEKEFIEINRNQEKGKSGTFAAKVRNQLVTEPKARHLD